MREKNTIILETMFRKVRYIFSTTLNTCSFVHSLMLRNFRKLLNNVLSSCKEIIVQKYYVKIM